MLKLVIKGNKQGERLYQGSQAAFAAELKWLATLFGIVYPDLTPYTLRRGGATWHFLKYGSLDATTVYGRWAQVKTCRIYVHGAAAALADWKLTDVQRSLLERGASIVERVFR